jgi:hypothetical protein
MFERYTEKARRVIFFGRYEASNLGTRYIDTEHLLLGLLRDNQALMREISPNIDYESAREEIIKAITPQENKIALSVDLPLSDASKRVLAYAAEEAERLGMKHIGTEHLLLGLVRDPEFPSAKFLARFDLNLESLRKRVETLASRPEFSGTINQFRRAPLPNTAEIHGKKLNAESLRPVVARLREHHFLWERRLWQPRDVVYEREGNRFSFDLGVAQDTDKFVLVRGGWRKDRCTICQWELFESDDATHSLGFTNGRDWICDECYGKFIENDFFASAYSDLT